MRMIDADALIEFCAERWIPLNVDAVNMQPTIQPEKAQLSQEGTTKGTTSDLISRQAAIDEIEYVKAMKRTAGMTYTQHLLKNWRVAFHALNDFFAHFIHGLIPAIKIRHHQPYQEGKQDRCPHCGADMRGKKDG